MIAHNVLEPLVALTSQSGPSTSHTPYGMNILIPAYITFIEPTVATFIVYTLIKDRLSEFSTILKGFIMGGIRFIDFAANGAR